MTKTQNYQLNQWNAADPIRREDFNADNAAIDAALAAIQQAADSKAGAETVAALAAGLGSGGKTCRMAFGTYTGTGKGGSSNPTTITVDFTPVLVIAGNATSPSSLYWPAIMIRPMTVSYSDSTNSLTVVWETNSVKWYNADSGYQMNDSKTTYAYVVLGYSEA